MPAVIKVALGSLGITGVMYVIGYVVDYSYRSFLGVGLSRGAALDYMLFAARFWVDLWQQSVEFLYGFASLPWQSIGNLVTTLLMLIAVSAAIQFARGLRSRLRERWQQRRRVRLAAPPWRISAAVLIAGGIIVMLLFDWPTVAVQDVLVKPATLGRSFESGYLVAPMVKAFWTEVVCSRVDQHIEPKCEAGTSAYKNRLATRFLVSFVWTVVLAGIAALLMHKVKVEREEEEEGPKGLHGGRTTIMGHVLLAGIWLVVAAKFFTLPYVYARTIRSTQVPEVVIDYEISSTVQGEIQDQTKDVIRVLVGDDEARNKREIWIIPRSKVRLIRYRETGGKRYGRVEYDTPGSPESIHGHVLGDNERTMILRAKLDQQVWEVSRARIRLVKIEGQSDVLYHHLLATYAAPKMLSPAGP